MLSKGILGINARNLLYIRPYNRRKAIKLADSKLKSKHFLSARGIPVPRLHGVIRNGEELEKFDFNTLPSNFVLKPNCGYGGEGIIPIIGRAKDSSFLKSSGKDISIEQMKDHIQEILDGRFSITGTSDMAFFEQLIVCDNKIAKYAYKGLPDIRVVVHNLIPVMAMLRLPTVSSDGKANLHLGAMAAGIDIAKGVVTNVLENNKIVQGPEGLRGFEIPYWDEILLISSKVQLITNLGYLAVDIAIDKSGGPVLLEVNARAGLGVQIANLAPLRKRLEQIKGVKVPTPEKGVRIAQDMFGHKVEKDIASVSGKCVVGEKEVVDIISKYGVKKVLASVNPVVEGSIIDQDFAKELGLLGVDEPLEGDRLKLKFSMSNVRIQTLVSLEDLSKRDYKLIIGKRDLTPFLIDPSKKMKTNLKIPTIKGDFRDEKEKSKINYSQIDKELYDIDRQIKLLYHLRPLNLNDERAEFVKNSKYNPQFTYPEMRFDPFRLREKLKKIKCDDSPLGKIFDAKKSEILKKLSLVEHVGTESFSEKSVELFGRPDSDLIKLAREKIESKPDKFPYEDLSIDHIEAGKRFEEVFKKYSLEDWKVKIKESMVADCMAGKKGVLFVREGSRFTEERLKMLVAHEIETHILTAENGKQQPYKIFNYGLAGYLETQEGLAVRNQMLVSDKDVEKNYWPALSVVIVDAGFEKSFAELVEIGQDMGFSFERAFRVAVKVKRGMEDTSAKGAFTKDYVYFKGYQDILEFESKNGNIRDLYVGKLNLRDLELIKQIPNLVEPKILPEWM
ncbi:MAG: tyrosine/phenylalanine carboxypeptidase domain-containing protein [Patescibacteria group bacterium]|nr:DUF1704 domain-containing protein [Patescibacteria group bacterium]